MRFLTSKAPVLMGLMVLIIIVTTGCSSDEGTFVRFLSIEGDVEQNITMNSGNPVKNDSAVPGENDFEGVPITEFIADAGISGTPKTIYMFSSGDGFVSSIDYDGAENVYVYFSKYKGWSTIAPNHPPAASGMDIDRIVVVSENSKVGLNVVDSNGSLKIFSMGELLLSPQIAMFNLDGTTENKSSGSPMFVSLYTRQYSIGLVDVDATYADVPFVITTVSGDAYLTEGKGQFILYRQKISYRETTGDIYEDVSKIELR